jgi:oxygen-independent coproporphyrinogen-3 oxidase
MAELHVLAEKAVPRYTSYPTVPHFTGEVTGEIYRGWLAALEPAEPVSLYLHIPFCRQLCWYCGCNMKLARRAEPVADYATMLREEIRLLAAALPARLPVAHVHFGGGTPTALASDDLARLVDALREAFDLLPDAELAIEADPRTLTADLTHRIGALGFTRASLGVQEFDPVVQKAINRIQPPAMVAECVEGLRAAGVDSINLDLIYGLPHQTTAMVVRTVETVATMAPDRVALFGYAHVPWLATKQRMIDAATLPGAAARREQAEAAAAALAGFGFAAVGLDHFAVPSDPLAVAAREGRLRRNFQGYTTDTAQTLLGLGASAIGRTPAGYVQAITEPGGWGRAVSAGTLPVARGRALTADDRLRGEIIERLMCDGAADVGAIAARHGATVIALADAWEALAPLEAAGVATVEAGRVAVTPAGRSLVRVVASAFDAYLAGGAARHSVAV